MAPSNKDIQMTMAKVKALLSPYVHDHSYSPFTVFCLKLNMAVILTNMAVILPAEDGDELITAFLQEPDNLCALLTAVFYNRIALVLDSEVLKDVAASSKSLWMNTLLYLAADDRWSCLKKLLQTCPQHSPQLFLTLAARPLTAEGLEVFSLLAMDCSPQHRYLLKQVTRWALHLPGHFKVLAFSPNPTVREVVSEGFEMPDILETLVRDNCLHRACLENFPGMSPNYNSCLSVAAEAGLFTVRPAVSIQNPCRVRSPEDLAMGTAMSLAVIYNQPDLVRYLYSVGGTNNTEIFHLSRLPALKEITEADEASQRERERWFPAPLEGFPSVFSKTAATTIQCFLSTAASRPRSLEKLCLLTVSRQVGWGRGRQARVAELDISQQLKEELTYQHIDTLLNNGAAADDAAASGVSRR